MNQCFRWGILGCGWIAEQFATDLALNQGSILHAVAARDPKRAQAFASKHGASKAYGHYEALITNPLVDVIYVALPHTLHFEWAKKALQAGKSVLVEKPFTLNAAQARTLFDLAAQQGVFAMEAFWTKFYPPVKAAVDVIQEGTLGWAQHLRAAFNLRVPFDASHRLYNKAVGGGALLDIGVYPLELALWLFGPPDSWEATHSMTATDVDAQFTIKASWQTGQQALLSAALDATAPSDVRIKTERGSMYIPDLWITSQNFEVTANTHRRRVQPPLEGNGLRYQALEVERCLAAGLQQSPQHSWDDTLTLLNWCDAIRASWGLRYAGEDG